jgi:DNA-binding response OmpR family regulator
MGVLTDKNVLFVGDSNNKVTELINEVKSHGVNVTVTGCAEVTPAYLKEHSIDLVVLNHASNQAPCLDILHTLQSADISNIIPVFAVVHDSADAIQEVLTNGAADYMTETEATESIIQKMKTIFGLGDNFSSASSIDITPDHADISSTGIKVYTVEDDPLLRNLLAVRFEKSAFPHEFSSDGKDAIPAMKQFKPDIKPLCQKLLRKSMLQTRSQKL